MLKNRGIWRPAALLAVLSAVIPAGVLGWRYAGSEKGITQLPELPALPNQGIDPAIASAIDRAASEVRSAPNSGAAWGHLGIVLLGHDFYEQARYCLAVAAERLPQDPRWPYYLGVSLSLDEPEAALPKLEEAAQLCNDNPDVARLRLAELLQRLGRLDEAEEQFRESLKHHPDNARAAVGLGRVLFQQGDAQGSLPYLQAASDHAATRKLAHQFLADAFQQLEEAETATLHRRLAAETPTQAAWRDPWYEEVLRLQTGLRVNTNRAIELMNAGRAPKALEILGELVRDYPKSDWAWFQLGKARVHNQLPRDAEDAFRKALELAPASAEYHFELGLVLFARDQQTALACFQKAVQLKPNYAEAHFCIGSCLFRVGDSRGAIAAEKTALSHQPNFVKAQVALADLLCRAGRFAEAIPYLLQAGAQRADDPEIRQLWQRILRHLDIPMP